MDNFSVLHGMAGNYGAGGFVNITVTVQFTKPLDCLLVASMVSREYSFQWLHSQPMDIFLFHRNCTSQTHGMARNHKVGGFAVLFTKPPASWFLTILWFDWYYSIVLLFCPWSCEWGKGLWGGHSCQQHFWEQPVTKELAALWIALLWIAL